MAGLTQKIGTFALSGETLTIDSTHGILGIGIQYVSGTTTYTGNLSVAGLTSSPLTLADGKPYFVSSPNPIESFVIDATGGACEVTLIK